MSSILCEEDKKCPFCHATETELCNKQREPDDIIVAFDYIQGTEIGHVTIPANRLVCLNYGMTYRRVLSEE